jgi:hypothetical protein
MINWYPAISSIVASAAFFYGIHLGRQFERMDTAKRQKAIDAQVPRNAHTKDETDD